MSFKTDCENIEIYIRKEYVERVGRRKWIFTDSVTFELQVRQDGGRSVYEVFRVCYSNSNVLNNYSILNQTIHNIADRCRESISLKTYSSFPRNVKKVYKPMLEYLSTVDMRTIISRKNLLYLKMDRYI